MQHPNHASRRHLGLLGGFALSLGLLVTTILVVFWLFLADYQKNLPQNFAEQVLSAYQAGDPKALESGGIKLPTPLEDPSYFAKYYEENADLASLYFYPETSKDPETLSYEFVSGKKRIATLNLHKTGQTTLFGFPRYEATALTAHPLTRYRITAPEDTTLRVNGQPVQEEFRTLEQTSIENFGVLENTIFKTKTYEIADFAPIDPLEASCPDGCAYTVTWDKEHRTATVEKQMKEEQKAEISAFATKFSQAYSVFATKKSGPRRPVLQLVHPHTPLYEALQLYTNEWGERYHKERYDNRTIDRFVQYSPTEFSCDIGFSYVIELDNGLQKAYPYQMTYYLTNRNGPWQLVDMQSQLS